MEAASHVLTLAGGAQRMGVRSRMWGRSVTSESGRGAWRRAHLGGFSQISLCRRRTGVVQDTGTPQQRCVQELVSCACDGVCVVGVECKTSRLVRACDCGVCRLSVV
jgi:hypothetical protein